MFRFILILAVVGSLEYVDAYMPGIARFGYSGRVMRRLQCEVAEEMEAPVDEGPVTHSVFVGNIPFTIEEDELVALVDEKAGSSYSSIRLVIDKKSGRSRGFAYVNFEDKTDAEATVEALAGLNLDGRAVRVELSVPGTKRERKPRGGDERSIFVGNLDFNVMEEDLRELVEEVLGENAVQAVRLAKDRSTGRPRGFGHVVFESEEQVSAAIDALNGAELMGRTIRVDKAQRKEDRPPKHSIYLGNLAWDATEELVKEMIDDVVGEGLFDTVRLATDRETGRHRGFGYVDFKTEDDAIRAITELGGLEVLGRQLRADLARPRESRPRRENYGGGGGGGGWGEGRGDDMGGGGEW